ncbi:pleckstrin homology domain-containing family G member 2-like isoform X2 [Sitophilus oryzae]|uniref:Pleckstrin homology domain-containing family G member 2-like isoform X2 n=1 Tax=Sitophilus oryzae TaxID=7048 RepID=A0A6J2X5N1_SITOR|nr:pleckstrin homology domain-containing family G member 2-like isoform X2 [Sitophilus oryzae]
MHGTKGCYDPQGSSPDLMPSIMGAFDAYLTQKKQRDHNPEEDTHQFKTSTQTRRSHQLNNFAHLSPCVQKILSHVPEQEISKKFSSEETLISKRNRMGYRSLRGTEKMNILNKSNESLDLSPGVHKLLSNLQDSELVISATNLHVRTLTSNDSYLHSLENRPKNATLDRQPSSLIVETSTICESETKLGEDEVKTPLDQCGNYVPLGSYLHSGKGIASRMPVGRKQMGKYLQVPSESSGVSASTSSPTSSSEVSRPVSMTSLASSSSESSGGHPQPCSAYLASVESLDSDPEPGGSQGSADSGIAEQEQIPIKPEQRVLQEVLDTETVYVADLNEVITGYLIPWRNDPLCPLAHCLTDLFSNIEEICKFNREILEDIRRANLDPSKTANVFLQHDAGFRVYNEYCANYPRTMEVLSELQKDEHMAPLFREKQQHLRHALPLGSYLLKPVQRILKYHLLLQRLSKQCEGNHKSTVDLALATMTAVASEINNMKKKHEYAVRVQEIQSQLYGWTGPDLTTLGELIAEGSFRVQGARGRRHVFLFEKVLLLAKTKTAGALAYKTHIECSNLMLVEQVRSDPLAFQVLPFDNPRQQCTLRARSTHHKREWTLQIKRVILENYSAVIPNHARQLVMQLGQDVTETEDASEKWSPLKHNSPTPHYLERRSRRKTQELMKDQRSASQDRMFPALGSWRRKSEPSMIPQVYDSKTVPKKISKLKKTKETGSSTFYTDISDVDQNGDPPISDTDTVHTEEDSPHSRDTVDHSPHTYGHDIKQIVSDLLMQNEDFKKVLNREHTRHPRRNINSEPGPLWYYEERLELPNKADSLPRSFQLNEPTEEGEERGRNEGRRVGESSKLNGCRTEGELSSQMTDSSDYPEHKIYRKSAIRTSLLQRIRTLISEDQKRPARHVAHDTNKATGEKLANPDYVDPQKLFIASRTNSELNISSESSHTAEKNRLYRTSPSDSYYESILDNSLTEEYVRDKTTGKMVVKSDSFNSSERVSFARPGRVPPPIPAKPLRLTMSKPRTSSNQITSQSSILNDNDKGNSREKSLKVPQKTVNGGSSTSWVKSMVDRFE